MFRLRKRGSALAPLVAFAVMMGAAAIAEASCPKGTTARQHAIEDGETLSEIAVRYGTSVTAIARVNGEVDPKFLRPGKVLKICAVTKAAKTDGLGCGKGAEGEVHEVRPGETLAGIAAIHGVTASSISSRNRLRDPNALRAGQRLEICAPPRSKRVSKACGNRTPIHRHEVIPGEHLAQVAGRYGVRRTDLFRLNRGLKDHPDLIRPGQTLLVCPEIAPRSRDRLTHTIADGETLGEIAKRYDLTVRELQSYQRGRLDDPNDLRAGRTLTVWADGGVLSGFGGVDDDTGVLPGGVQLPSGKNYVVKSPALAWGTTKTVRLLQSAIANYAAKAGGGPKIHVGDISKRGGGRFPPHASHQHGRDIDIGYVLRGDVANETRFTTANSGNLDVARTWKLLKAITDTDQVQYIFMDYSLQELVWKHARERGVTEDTLDELLQYPRGKHRGYGLIRHWKGHKDHFHVRFRRD